MLRIRVAGFVHRHRSALAVGAVLAAVATGQAILTTTRQVDAATLLPTGRALAANCAQCHGTNGGNGGFSALAGIPVKDMMEKMKDQQSHSSIMGAQARGYTDRELLAIATFFASLPKP